MAVVYASVTVGAKRGETYPTTQAGGGSSHPSGAHVSIAVDSAQIANMNQLKAAVAAILPQIKSSLALTDG